MLNWKTSLSGIATIAIPLINQIIPILPPQYVPIAAGVAAGLGLFFAKDYNVSGGTKK